MTPALRKFLEFMAATPHVSMFPAGFGSITRRRAMDAGLIETCGSDPGAFGLTRFRLTQRGRDELATVKART